MTKPVLLHGVSRPTIRRHRAVGAAFLGSLTATTGPAFSFGGEVRLAFVDAAGNEPVLSSTLSGKYPDLRPTP